MKPEDINLNGQPAHPSRLRSANPYGISYEVVVLEPPVAGQLETTVEQTGIWKEKDRYVVERQAEYARAIARILGHGSFLGRTISDAEGLEQVERDIAAGDNFFFVPHMTLCDPDAVARLGINVGSFYGGAVGCEHERTKLIMHDLLHADSVRPDAWNEGFARAIADLSLPGYSVFSVEDMEAATREILERFGRARIKLATGADGLGQFVVERLVDLDTVLRRVMAASCISYGACVEVDLSDPVTYSVNMENIGAFRMSSVGIHRRHVDDPEAQTEIGTDYNIVVGDVHDIRLDLTELAQDHVRPVVDLTREFDRRVSRYMPQIMLTRKTYQSIVGTDARGGRHVGILEQSWRRGGSSANTLLAAQEFLKDPDLIQVSCSQDNAFAGVVEPDYWVLSTCRKLPVVSRITGRHYA